MTLCLNRYRALDGNPAMCCVAGELSLQYHLRVPRMEPLRLPRFERPQREYRRRVLPATASSGATG